MKKSFIIVLLAGSSALFADSILPGVGPWQTVVTPTTIAGGIITSSDTTTPGNNAYWNNASTDAGLASNVEGYSATNCWNIGCFMTGSGVWTNPAGPVGDTVGGAANLSPNLANPVYVGNNDGSAVADIYFSAPGVANPTTMLAELAGPTDRDWMGWYDANLTAAQLTVANKGISWDIIFSSLTTTGSTANFNPTANFGLFFFDAPGGQQGSAACGSVPGCLSDAQIVANLNSVAYYTQSSKNTLDGAGSATAQHFAVFASSAAAGGVIPADFWVGVEDLPGAVGAGSDRDMNDMIVRLRVVPEPGYFILLSLGLGGLGLARRRFKKTA